MTKIAAAVVLVLLLTGSAGAVTLEITSGRIGADQLNQFDAGVDLIGPGFQMGGAVISAYMPLSDFDAEDHFGLAGMVLAEGIPLHIVRALLHFSYLPGTLMTPDLLIHISGSNRGTTEPFTATGAVDTLNSATGESERFGLIGQGTVHAFWRPGSGPIPCCDDFVVDYTFTAAAVAEPATLDLLLATGATFVLLSRSARHFLKGRLRPPRTFVGSSASTPLVRSGCG